MSVLPALRSDLVIKEQTVKNEKSYIFKDPIKQAYFRFEEEEHFVIIQLDGHKTAADIATLYNERFDDELSASDIKEFLNSIRDNDFFEKTEEEENTYLYEKLKEQRRSRILQAKGSAMYFRVSIWDPDRFFDKVMPYIHWIWSPKFVLLMNLFMLGSLVLLLQNIAAVNIGLEHILDFSSHTFASVFFLWLTVLGTIGIHELGHGLTCKRFGGECHEIGFLFMFCNPCLYANVNDAWLFEQRRHRLFVTFAGCYVEFLFGFVMLHIWLLTQPGTMPNILSFQVVIVSFFSAIFMNFNPLMKFDGYFALSDALETPNLRDRSQGYVKHVVQTKFFRLEREFELLSKREERIFFSYGALVIIYLVHVFSGIGFMIGGILTGLIGKIPGLLLTFWILYKLLGRYFFGTWRFIKVLMVEHEKFFGKTTVRLVGAGLLLTLLGTFIFLPFPLQLESDGELEAVNDSIVRALSSGYVLPLSTPEKQAFGQGELLIELRNRDLEQQILNHQLDLQITDAQLQAAIAQGSTVDALKLRQVQQKLKEISTDLNRQFENLKVFSPFSGVLETPLVGLENTYLNQGDPIGRLIDPQEYQATINLLERDLESIAVGTQAYLAVDAHGETVFNGSVTEIATMHKQQGIARTYQVTVTFPNRELALRSGLDGTVSLDIGTATGLQRVIRWFQKTIRLDLLL